MKVLVLGAGIIGVSTAYYLARAGHQVVVVDRQSDAALETSFANGGQLSASHAWPWANPGTLARLPGWLARADAPLAFRPRLDPAMWGFFVRFLANCTPGRARANGDKALTLALYSRETMKTLRAESGIDFAAEDRGILHVYRSARDLDRAAAIAERFRALGLETDAVNAAACVRIEPALASVRDELAGGIFSPQDLSGDARLFTQNLARLAQDAGAEFRLETKILRLAKMGGRITGVVTDHGMMTANAYVCALASYSTPILKDVGIRIPVYPAKGYSATVPVTSSNRAPFVSITDDDHKIVLSRIGDAIRIAGTAEFDGYNTSINQTRARAVLDAGMKLFPGAMEPALAEFWAGLRPLTADGVPIIGKSQLENLYLNTGHGTLGWTMGAGSGRALAELMSGRDPGIDLAAYDAGRF